jgi:lipopolysaccharide transport system ATP-binding protein
MRLENRGEVLPGADVRPVVFSSGNPVVIRFEEVWKQYRLGVINHGTLAHDLQSWWARLRGKEDPNIRFDQPSHGKEVADRFWALRNVSFDVCQGDVFGIIGQNGAGKSTLLKILSKVTAPTRGQIKIKGRIASLLEVGTGFHPELTGRENVFLNGAILGMNKAEIAGKLDEIIAFAEIEKFIDTPVKRYSSGMYVRLAFAVAAHLEPEILVVDEVLSVGDAQFQKKCLGKMEEVGREGRTILFVSHNMTAVRNLCPMAVWLKAGQLYQSGHALEITENYLRQNLTLSSLDQMQSIIHALPEDPAFRLENITIKQSGELCAAVLNGIPIEVGIYYTVRQRLTGLRVYFDVCDEERNILIRSFNDNDEEYISMVEPGRYVSVAIIPADLLAPRSYELRVYGTIYNVRSLNPGGVGIPLEVQKSNDINRAYPNEPIRSKLLLRIPWTTKSVVEGP